MEKRKKKKNRKTSVRRNVNVKTQERKIEEIKKFESQATYINGFTRIIKQMIFNDLTEERFIFL